MVIAESKLSWSPRCINGGGIPMHESGEPNRAGLGKAETAIYDSHGCVSSRIKHTI